MDEHGLTPDAAWLVSDEARIWNRGSSVFIRGFKALFALPTRGWLLFAAIVAFAAGGCRREDPSLALPARPSGVISEALRKRIDDAERAIRRAPDDAEAWAALAMVYHANGCEAQALPLYRRALTGSSPNVGRLHYLAALAAEATGDTAAAAAALRDSLQHAPNHVPALLRLADLHFKAGEADAAIGHYRAALALEPECPEALLALAREELRRDNDSAALQFLERLASSHPEYGSGLSLQAQLLERRGNRPAAAALRREGRGRKDPPMNDPILDAVMQSCVDLGRLSLRFEDALNASRIDDALATLDRMQALDPGHWLPRRMRGFAFAHTGRLEAAAVEYRKAIELGGDPATVYPGLVSALMKLERFEEAARAAREGLVKAPASGPLRVVLADLALKENKRDEAESLLTQALAVDDRDLAAHRALGRLKWEAHRETEAMRHFETIVLLDPTEVPARLLIGQHHLQTERPEQAIAPLTQAAALEPGNTNVRHLLALSWLRHGNRQARDAQFDEALTSYGEALRIEPAHVEARTNRDRVLAHLRRIEETANVASPRSE